MLVLQRVADERVIIQVGDVRIEVVVVDIRRHGDAWVTRLGFQAPKHVKIDREEVADAKSPVSAFPAQRALEHGIHGRSDRNGNKH